MRLYLRRGFTLIELLVVIAIIGVLVAITLPAVQRMREVSRRNTCQNNLTQLGMATLSFEMAHGRYPSGSLNPTGPIESVASGLHHNWISHLMPYLDRNNVYKAVDFDASVYDPKNAEIRKMRLRILECPSSSLPQAIIGFSSYAAVHHDVEAPIAEDNQGTFFLNSRVTPEDVVDGTSQTLFFGEKNFEKDDLGWMSGTRATLRNTGTAINLTGKPVPVKMSDSSSASANDVPPPAAPTYVGGFGSLHGPMALFIFGDGQARTLSSSIDAEVFRLLGNRADRKVVSENDY